MTCIKDFFHPAKRTISNLDLAEFLIQLESRIMTKLQDLQEAIAAEDKVITSAVTLINGIADRIAAAGTDDKALSDLTDDIRSQSQALSAAITKNTPADTGATGVVAQPAANDGSTPAPAPEAA